MRKFLGSILYGMVDALHTRPTGFSARKLTALVIVCCIVYIHAKFVEAGNSVTVLVYDMLFVLLLLGIVTIDQLYRFKNGAPLSDPKSSVQSTPPTPAATPVTGTTETNNTIIEP